MRLKNVSTGLKDGAEPLICGLVMPISSIDGCSEEHWKDVLGILSDSVSAAGYEPNLVSNDTDIGVIHKRIVQNLYSNPIVICDVSGKNPNVMFELGMRLAFDKPVIIIKDDKTPYSFDTAPVEHLTYPRDLRFGLIVEFKARLIEKIKASTSNQNSFLGSFGTFKVAKIEEKSASALEVILDEMNSLKNAIARIEKRAGVSRGSFEISSSGILTKGSSLIGTPLGEGTPIFVYSFGVSGDQDVLSRFTGAIKALPFVKDVYRFPSSSGVERFGITTTYMEASIEPLKAIETLASQHSLSIEDLRFDRLPLKFDVT